MDRLRATEWRSVLELEHEWLRRRVERFLESIGVWTFPLFPLADPGALNLFAKGGLSLSMSETCDKYLTKMSVQLSNETDGV